MYINATGYYVPSARIGNGYFYDVNGLTAKWIEQRTGIKTRSKALPIDTIVTMMEKALINALQTLPYDIKEIDLIVSATYTPEDTVVTPGHYIQHLYNINSGVRVIYLTTACSSFMNALEVVEGYFATGKAQKALILGGEHNSRFANEFDPKAGHLWGDAAVAMFLSKERIGESDPRIVEVMTEGMAHLPKAIDAIHLRPRGGFIEMDEGKDVFMQACSFMPRNVIRLLENNRMELEQLSYLIGHQANMRILMNVGQKLGLPTEKLLTNIEEYGNTGSASCVLVYAENVARFGKGDSIIITTFGGGYSTGACLIRYE